MDRWKLKQKQYDEEIQLIAIKLNIQYGLMLMLFLHDYYDDFRITFL